MLNNSPTGVGDYVVLTWGTPMAQDVRGNRLPAPPPKPASESIYALLLISRVSLLSSSVSLGRWCLCASIGVLACLPNSTHTDLSSFRVPNSFYHQRTIHLAFSQKLNRPTKLYYYHHSSFHLPPQASWWNAPAAYMYVYVHTHAHTYVQTYIYMYVAQPVSTGVVDILTLIPSPSGCLLIADEIDECAFDSILFSTSCDWQSLIFFFLMGN